MSLVRMSLSGYRCFARRQDIDLAPITVVLGRNNSGKSALVRAPVLLETGFHTRSSAPLDLDRIDEDMLDSFNDLTYGHRSHHPLKIDLELQGDDGVPIRVTANVNHLDESRTEIISELTMHRDGDELVRFEWELIGPTRSATYALVTPALGSVSVPVSFRGFLPYDLAGVPDAIRTDLAALVREAADAYPVIHYFGPFRQRPRRRYRLPGRMPTTVGVQGEHTAQVLIDDHVRGAGQLAERVNTDLAGLLGDWTVGVVERGGLWAVILTARNDRSVTVNLADAGTGVAQALPIVVQHALDVMHPAGKPVLEIVEQPELHLHPAAHADLADLYLGAVAGTSTRFLIETHSETFLLRLRRRIAEGLDPAQVAVYFVENVDGVANAQRVTIDEDGNLDYWPTGVFSEDYEETRALAQAQWTKQDARAR